MIIKDFNGYREGQDITQIPANYLAYPSKNVLVHKGKIYTRLGLDYFGAEGTQNEKVHSEFVWKNSKAGRDIGLRVAGDTLQFWAEPWKTGAGWVNIFSGFDSDMVATQFAEWVDINTPIIKARLFMADGGENLYQWNGGIAIVDTVVGSTVTIQGVKTLGQLGFDGGSSTTQTVIINGVEYTYTNDPTGGSALTLSSAPSGVVQGDIVLVKPLTHTTTLTGVDKDHLFTYKEHLVVASLDSVEVYFSHATTYSMATGLDFTLPAPASRTAVSPMYFTLDGFITAMHERKSILWISTVDDWFKIEKLYEINGYDEWATVNKVQNALRKGAIPYAVSAYKSEMLFIAQDKTVQSVSDLEILQSDTLKLISDDIEALLVRLDLTDSRIYYHGRYIFILVPAESTMLIFDTVEGYWQPPQDIPASCMSIIDGERIGHSNNRDESFTIFSGRQDLGSDIIATIALGYQGLEDQTGGLILKWYDILGFAGYINTGTIATVRAYFETDGATAVEEMVIDGSKIKKFGVEDDTSLGKHPFGSRSFAGGDEEVSDLSRFYVFDRSSNISFFEWRPIIEITGEDIEFHLNRISVDVDISDRAIPNDLFIAK